MATGQQSLRKAIGAIKDSTTVGLAKVNSDYKALDVAIIKATYHDEIVSKEKHIRTIMQSLAASNPRMDVAYCLHALGKRLAKTRNWAQVALKTLIIIHRAMREVDPSIREVLVNFSKITNHMLNLSHFKDESSRNAWDCAAWVRSYALYLQERLQCFRELKYDIQSDHSRTKELDTSELLKHLPPLQLLLFRLVCCRPMGAARSNCLIQYALSIVAAESVRIYVAIADGVLKLVDKFFEMRRYDAVRALDIYRKSVDQAEWLSEFFEICRALDIGRGQNYVKIEKPPESFILTMEEYVKDSSEKLALPWRPDYDENSATHSEIVARNSDSESDHMKDNGPEGKSDTTVVSLEAPENGNSSDNGKAVAVLPIADLLSFDDLTQEASEQNDENSLALAIVTPDNPPCSSSSSTLASSSNGWELAPFTEPSSKETAIAQSKLAGELDRLTLDSLYNNAMASTNQNIGNGTYHTGEFGPNPFETMGHNQDSFFAPANMAPQTNMQMITMGQQQEAFLGEPYQQSLVAGHDPTNPFGNPFVDQVVSPYSAQKQDVSPHQALSTDGSPFPAQYPGASHYATQSPGGSTFPAQTPDGLLFPGQILFVSPYPYQNSGGSLYPAQSPGDSPFPSQSLGDSAFPGQSAGMSPFPAQNSGISLNPPGDSPFSGQSLGTSPFPGQSASMSPPPAQNLGVSHNPTSNQDPFASLRW